MPLLDDMKATLKADLDVTNMNHHLKSYIQQEIQKGVEIAMRDEMKKLVNKGVEMISSTVEATVDKQVTTGTSYIQWGTMNCTNYNAELIYSGFVGGSSYTGGGAPNKLCVPKAPQWGIYDDKCAVCHVTKATSTIMIPGRTSCYENWKMEYHGYLMAGYPGHKAASEYICVDGNPDHITKVPSWTDKSVLYSVYSKCNGATPCPPYVNGREMTCVVCSR
ncbi:unnamed protein product [Mytilus edulis]|uniref:Short-chain collagen C4-like n=1 Tax=Mytilus edulis TaxID=6550 RepID=A0A8S3PVS5_MYTED|nr:unnamed protein product [Mytilus edulis]